MVLKPKEFQRIALIHLGHEKLANYLDEQGMVFTPTTATTIPCEKLASYPDDLAVMNSLLPYMASKSYLGPIVRNRLAQVAEKTASAKTTLKEVDSPLLSKVASAYTWYRKELMNVASQIPNTVTSNPALHAAVFGLGDEDIFSKTAGKNLPARLGEAADIPLDHKSIAVLLGAIPLALMYSAHKKQKMEQGEDVGLLDALVAEHPWLTSMATVSGLGAALRNPHVAQAVDELFAAGSRIWKGKQLPVKGAV